MLLPHKINEKCMLFVIWNFNVIPGTGGRDIPDFKWWEGTVRGNPSVSQWEVREFYPQVAAWVLLGFFASKRQFCFKITCKASLFLLIHGHNTHPAESAKIAFQLVKSRYFFSFRWVWTLCEVLSSFVNEPQFVIDNIWFVNVLDWNGNEIISKKDV